MDIGKENYRKCRRNNLFKLSRIKIFSDGVSSTKPTKVESYEYYF